MACGLEDGLGGDTLYDFRDGREPDDFLHPAYAQPSHVISLTLNEERAILASWAPDVRAPEEIFVTHRAGMR